MSKGRDIIIYRYIAKSNGIKIKYTFMGLCVVVGIQLKENRKLKSHWYIYIYIYIYIYRSAHEFGFRSFFYTFFLVSCVSFIHTYIHTYIYVCVCVCVCVLCFFNIYIYIYIYIYILLVHVSLWRKMPKDICKQQEIYNIETFYWSHKGPFIQDLSSDNLRKSFKR